MYAMGFYAGIGHVRATGQQLPRLLNENISAATFAATVTSLCSGAPNSELAVAATAAATVLLGELSLPDAIRSLRNMSPTRTK